MNGPKFSPTTMGGHPTSWALQPNPLHVSVRRERINTKQITANETTTMYRFTIRFEDQPRYTHTRWAGVVCSMALCGVVGWVGAGADGNRSGGAGLAGKRDWLVFYSAKQRGDEIVVHLPEA